jgi:ABC-type nickel/cobalt efflux system permease component RcnA
MYVPPAALIRVLALVALCVAAPAAAQNPWSVTPARPATPGPTSGEGGAVPRFLRPIVEPIAAAQRELNRTISRELRAVRETGSAKALLVVTGVAFVYGMLHAAGPGHGKLVVSSFFLARHARIGAGILTGTAISFLQAATSIVLVCGLGVILGQHGFDVLGRSVWLEALSYALIIAIGLVIAVSAVRGAHRHGHDGRTRVGTGVVIAAGVTPCASALIIMLFALTNGVLLVGIGATLVMAVGMSLTTSLVGILAILSRRTIMVTLPGSARWRDRVSTGLSVAGGMIIAVVGGLLLAGAWARLG